MRTEYLERYVTRIEEKLRELGPLISSSQISIERRSLNRTVLRGIIVFVDGSSLHFLEYVLEEDNRLLRVSYRFHYIKQNGSLVFRYDNAPHHPELPTFPHHKHLPGKKVVSSSEKSLIDILDEIGEIISKE